MIGVQLFGVAVGLGVKRDAAGGYVSAKSVDAKGDHAAAYFTSVSAVPTGRFVAAAIVHGEIDLGDGIT